MSAKKGPIKFGTKDEIKNFIDKTCEKNGLDDRDHLARILGISSSALYGYIYRLEIPTKVHQKMLTLSKEQVISGSKSGHPKASSASLTEMSLDELLAEIERRGWKVDLSRIAKK
jgi:hypothetical protein